MAVCPEHIEAEPSAEIKKPTSFEVGFLNLAERTGLEPATPGVTGRYSNQLNYRSRFLHLASKLGLLTRSTVQLPTERRRCSGVP
jgi:hypothetical protein